MARGGGKSEESSDSPLLPSAPRSVVEQRAAGNDRQRAEVRYLYVARTIAGDEMPNREHRTRCPLGVQSRPASRVPDFESMSSGPAHGGGRAMTFAPEWVLCAARGFSGWCGVVTAGSQEGRVTLSGLPVVEGNAGTLG